MILQVLDIIGCMSGIYGAILVGQINKYGYVGFMLCNLAYGTLGLIEGHYGLVGVSIVMFIIDCYYYIKWSKTKQKL